MTPQAGLSFEQAPPILVPFRFFLGAPLFAVLASLLMLWQGPALFDSRWLPPVLALTHLMTLGFLGFAMLGALFQMLPVVAGAPVARPQIISLGVLVLLVSGVLALAGGFLLESGRLMQAATFLLGGSFALFIGAAGLSLARATANPTSRGMRLAFLALTVTATLGVLLASNHGWGWWIIDRVQFTTFHLTWGLLGWVGLLVVSVSYQVVPMFQLTPAYPKPLTTWLTGGLSGLLLCWTLAALAGAEVPATLAGALLALGFALYAAATIHLQRQRRRKVADVTLLFWRYGMVALPLALALWLAGQLVPPLGIWPGYPFLLGILFIGGFAVSVVNGMLYKIVPFLIWFHLQSQLTGIAKVPNMKEILPEKRMRHQMWVHFCAMPLLALSTLQPWLIWPAAAILGASMLMLEANLLFAFRIYRGNIQLVS
jgi:hypothetical protein